MPKDASAIASKKPKFLPVWGRKPRSPRAELRLFTCMWPEGDALQMVRFCAWSRAKAVAAARDILKVERGREFPEGLLIGDSRGLLTGHMGGFSYWIPGQRGWKPYPSRGGDHPGP